MIDLDAIEARAKAATPGPWHTAPDEDIRQNAAGIWAGNEDRFIGVEIVKTDCGVYPPEMPDALFIAHAREDIPALIAEVRRLQTCMYRVYDVAKREHWDEAEGGGFLEAWNVACEAISLNPPDLCPHGFAWERVGECAACFLEPRPCPTTTSEPS